MKKTEDTRLDWLKESAEHYHSTANRRTYHHSSGLKKAYVNLDDYQNWLDGNEPPPSPALRFGAAAHTYVLEKHLFNTHYFVNRGKTPAEKTKITKEERAGKGREVISLSDFTDIQFIRMGYEDAVKMIRRELFESKAKVQHKYEKAYYWDEISSDGVIERYAAKADHLMLDEENKVCVAVDLKTTSKGTECIRPFEYRIEFAPTLYGMQAAQYLWGLRKKFDESWAIYFCFVAISKEPPYSHNIIKIDSDSPLYERHYNRVRNTVDTIRESEGWDIRAPFSLDGGYFDGIVTLESEFEK